MMLLAALGGGLGAMCRFLLDSQLANKQWRTMKRLLLINVLGSVALGIVVGWGSQPAMVLLGTGFCGGFTTFSTAMVELAGQGRKVDVLYLMAMSALALVGYAVAVHLMGG